MTPALKKLIVIVVVIGIIAFVIYNYMSSSNSASPEGGLGTVVVDNSNNVGSEVINTLIRIKQLKIDDTIFKDEVYRSLRDFSMPIIPQPKGRANPFDPISSSVGSAISTSTKSAGTNQGL